MTAEYERQWRLAQGHARRHPLRLKMDRLADVRQRDLDGAAFEARLREGMESTDIAEALLCNDLLPRWLALQRGESSGLP